MKKIFALTIASFIGLSAQAAFAGGPEDPVVPAPAAPVTYSGTYLEGELGYGVRDWGNTQVFTGTSTQNQDGGFSAGFDVGYQFNEFISLEGGWLYFPQFSETALGVSDTLTGWAAYGGLKFTIPLIQDLFIFSKIAAAYNQWSGSNNVVVNAVNYSGDNNYWAPLFGFGLQYYFNQNISINAEYIFVNGNEAQTTAQGRTPNENLFLAGLGYKFAI